MNEIKPFILQKILVNAALKWIHEKYLKNYVKVSIRVPQSVAKRESSWNH